MTRGVRAWNDEPFPILVDLQGAREADVRVEVLYRVDDGTTVTR